MNNFNLKIVAGSTVGIVGSTGSGKSTFLDLLLGLLNPSSGEITIDGQKLSSKNILNYQSIISSVAQTPAFLDASIDENIVFHIKHHNFL